MNTTDQFIQDYQRKVKDNFMNQAQEQARNEELIRDLITDSPHEGIKNLKLLNDYHSLISKEGFEELENICVRQIGNSLFG